MVIKRVTKIAGELKSDVFSDLFKDRSNHNVYNIYCDTSYHWTYYVICGNYVIVMYDMELCGRSGIY